jgi:hypothetical protein
MIGARDVGRLGHGIRLAGLDVSVIAKDLVRFILVVVKGARSRLEVKIVFATQVLSICARFVCIHGQSIVVGGFSCIAKRVRAKRALSPHSFECGV